MPREKKSNTSVFNYIGIIGSILLLIGCFCPIDASLKFSPVQLLFSRLQDIGRQSSANAWLEVLLVLTLLFVTVRSVMAALFGQVAKLRTPSIQIWVILVVFYSYYFGTPIPLHYGADWGWSVLFLGATLQTFGAFRSAMESEVDDEAQSG